LAERNFAIVLILGVVACQGELDYLLDSALVTGSIKSDVRDALRISTYEMVFLHKEIPVVVDQGVELVRSFAPYASGFANKILRQVAKLKEDFPFGDVTCDVEALAHQQAFPGWFAKRLIAEFGFASATAFMEASNQQAPVFLADIARGTTVEVAAADFSAWLPRIEAGEFIVADASAQKVAALATPSAGGDFLEVGSGRGTKTVLLYHNARRARDLDGPPARIYALDRHAFKQTILQERIKRYHLEDVIPVVGDALRLDELVSARLISQDFGGALIDAPCSGTGTLRRHPEIRWRLTPEDVTAMAAQGLAMLQAVARHIKPGGFVVYSTCSALREENEQVIDAFLASDDGEPFVLDPSTIPPNPFRSTLTPTSPDAHFAAKLRRQPRP
jgi:16S rRNA (cytosine967-C5)-methyltransferase